MTLLRFPAVVSCPECGLPHPPNHACELFLGHAIGSMENRIKPTGELFNVLALHRATTLIRQEKLHESMKRAMKTFRKVCRTDHELLAAIDEGRALRSRSVEARISRAGEPEISAK